MMVVIRVEGAEFRFMAKKSSVSRSRLRFFGPRGQVWVPCGRHRMPCASQPALSSGRGVAGRVSGVGFIPVVMVSIGCMQGAELRAIQPPAAQPGELFFTLKPRVE